MVQHIMNIRTPGTEAILDNSWWVKSSKGDFTVKLAFHILRRKKQEKNLSSYMCVKGIPYNIRFFFLESLG